MPAFLNVLSDGSVGCRKCTKCELGLNAKLVTNCMASTGSDQPVFFIVGHSTGVEDDRIGKPHTGKNGRLLRDFLSRASIPDSWIRFGNALRCASHDRDPGPKHWKACQPHFVKELEQVKPQAIITLGAKAFSWLTGYSGIRQFRRRGLPCLLNPSIPVYPFVQPVSILQAENDLDARKAEAEFVSDLVWLKNKADEGSLDNSDDVKTDYKLAETVDDVRAFLAEFEDVEDVCFDLETSDANLNPVVHPGPGCDVVLYTFSKGPGHARAIPGRARGRLTAWWWSDEELAEIKGLLKAFFSRQDKWFYGHNAAMFDRKWILVLLGVLPRCRYDTEYHHYLIDENLFHGLEGIVLQYTTMPPWKPPSLEVMMKEPPSAGLAPYGCKDADGTARIKSTMPYDDRMRWLMENLLIPLSYEYLQSEIDGVKISEENLAKYGQYLDELMQKHEKVLRSLAVVKQFELAENTTFNPDAPHQVAEIMEKYLSLPKIKDTEKGKGYCTDNSVLEHYLHEDFVQCIYYLRKIGKLKSTYWKAISDKVKENPLVSTHIRLDNTVTGRPTSNDPNFYNQPREDTVERTGITEPEIAQAIFEAREGELDPVLGAIIKRILVKVDMSQIELRVLASLSKDQTMIDIFKSGQDLHLETAKRVLGKEKVTKGERTGAKRINFGIPYGQSERGLAEVFVLAMRKAAKEEGKPFGPEEEAEARKKAGEFLALHKKTFPGVWAYLKKQEQIISKVGYQDNPFGRRRNHQSTSNRAKRQGYNYPIQSTASDLLYFALLWSMDTIRKLGLDAKLILTVYDSIILDCAEKDASTVAEILQSVMEEALNAAFDWILVPIKADVEIGPNLGYMMPWKKAA